MKKFLVICGPTATGKTSLALSLAKKYKAELVSADSRQVYKGMDIGTGKDIPRNSSFQFPVSSLKKDGIGCYLINGLRLWCYDLVDPTEEFGVAQYIRIADKIIGDIWKRGKLPILVGGTGFYIKALIDGIGTVQVPKDKDLRDFLEDKSVTELQNILKKYDLDKLKTLNESDVKNPRRLIRSIEVAKYKKRAEGVPMMNDSLRPRIIEADKKNLLFIGLKAPKSFLDKRIDKRVDKRVRQGIEREIVGLLKSGVKWNSQAMQSLGYRQWSQYSSYLALARGESTGQADKNVLRDQVINDWKTAEKQYAKRQMTWFKKDKRIKWFDISEKNWKKEVEAISKPLGFEAIAASGI